MLKYMKPGDIVLHQYHSFFDDCCYSYNVLILAKKDMRFIVLNLQCFGIEIVYKNELFDL